MTSKNIMKFQDKLQLLYIKFKLRSYDFKLERCLKTTLDPVTFPVPEVEVEIDVEGGVVTVSLFSKKKVDGWEEFVDDDGEPCWINQLPQVAGPGFEQRIAAQMEEYFCI